MEENKNNADTARFHSELFGWGESLVGILVFFVLIFTFVVRLVGVDGSSMYPTLEDHNIMLVSNLSYEPQKGDIVILNKESFYAGMPIVKRIIATAGDTVDIDFGAGAVYVNGEKLDEPYVAEPTYEPEDFTGAQTVPEGCIFVMGDNRNHSTDSRTADLGMVDTRYILGRALTVVFPFSQIHSLLGN